MTENKRYKLSELFSKQIIQDDGEALTQYEVVDKLNEQEETINELKQRNQRQYNRLKELGDLMLKRDWKTLNNMVDDWEKADELLKKEWGTYCENK